METVITEMIHQRVLDDTLNQRFRRRSLFDTFMHVSFEKIVNYSSFTVFVAAFVLQREINVAEEVVVGAEAKGVE